MGYSIFIEETKGGEKKFRAILKKNLSTESVKASNDFKVVLEWYKLKRQSYPEAVCFIRTAAGKIVNFPTKFFYEGTETKFSAELYGFELGKTYKLLKGDSNPGYVEINSPAKGGVALFPFQFIEPAEIAE